MKKYSPYFFLAIAIILFLSNLLQKISYAPDDTFIYMQYARNIAYENGFSFNPGEPSYGITSPLWVLLVSLAYVVGIDGFWFTKILDLIFAICSIYFMYRFSVVLFKNDRYFCFLTPSLLLINVWFIRWSFTGMETNLSVLCVLLIFYFYYRDSYNLAFFFLGILCLLRPEGLVLFAVILSVLLFEKHKFIKLEYGAFIGYILIFLIVISPFLAFAYSTFGTITPNTVVGKATFSFSLDTVTAQIKEILETLTPSSVLEILLTIVFMVYSIRHKKFWVYTALWLWPPALLLMYIITDSDVISRYLMLIVPVFTIFAVKAIEIVETKKYLLGTLLFVFVALQSQFVFYNYVKPHVNQFTAGVNECLIPIGKWFKDNTPSDTRILINDVGAVGFYSERYIIDAAALINRDLELNEKIMLTPVEERGRVSNLLKYVDAGYIVERDSVAVDLDLDDSKLKFQFFKIFPGLGISDPTPRYFKVYKVTK